VDLPRWNISDHRDTIKEIKRVLLAGIGASNRPSLTRTAWLQNSGGLAVEFRRLRYEASIVLFLALYFADEDPFDEGPEFLSGGEARSQARLDVLDPAVRKPRGRVSLVAELDYEGT
jgi:hypothetical protein